MTQDQNTQSPLAERDEHWVRTLYERYVQLYGDSIEQPITKDEPPHFA